MLPRIEPSPAVLGPDVANPDVLTPNGGARPGVNVGLLDRTLAYIEAHPGEWYQADWRCDSGLCFAGWAAILAGATFAADLDAVAWDYDLSAFAHNIVVGPDGDRRHVQAFASKALGLSRYASVRLFHGGNALDDIRDRVAEIKAGDLS